MWGRVMAATPDDDSFFVRVTNSGTDILPATTWSIGTHEKWEWVRFPEKIILPQGETKLQLRVREDGAKIDRLFLTRDCERSAKMRKMLPRVVCFDRLSWIKNLTQVEE